MWRTLVTAISLNSPISNLQSPEGLNTLPTLHFLGSSGAFLDFSPQVSWIFFEFPSDAMPKRVLCKFSARGACLKGEHCEFSHDWKDPPYNICTFYQSGVCAYGSQCRYEHINIAGTAACGAETGDCTCGESCPDVHGDIGPICRKQYLQPQEREHLKMCEERNRHLEALRNSRGIECCVCLEYVLSKPTRAERKFGILSECDHPFCISCIRNWRSSSPASGLNGNSALRSCPLCRKLSYFVIPSISWYSSNEEKQDIIKSYKAKLSTIDCKHFNFGNGKCPFRTNCFYKHACQDRCHEKVALRLHGSGDGNTMIAKNIRYCFPLQFFCRYFWWFSLLFNVCSFQTCLVVCTDKVNKGFTDFIEYSGLECICPGHFVR